MAFVLIIVGVGLLVAAWNSRDDVTRYFPIFLLVCALANFGGAAHMIATDFRYAYKLAPNPHNR